MTPEPFYVTINPEKFSCHTSCARLSDFFGVEVNINTKIKVLEEYDSVFGGTEDCCYILELNGIRTTEGWYSNNFIMAKDEIIKIGEEEYR